jgi:hypothetical protein
MTFNGASDREEFQRGGEKFQRKKGVARCPPCSQNAHGWSFWPIWSFGRMSGPTNQTNQIDEIDQTNQSSFDARSGRPIQDALLGGKSELRGAF